MLGHDDEPTNLKAEDVHEKYGFIFWISWGVIIVAVLVYFVVKAFNNKQKRGQQVRLEGSTALESDYDVDSAR